jgi:hypothetical protein
MVKPTDREFDGEYWTTQNNYALLPSVNELPN